MAEIKPVLNNFSSGEITPDAFGMVGSPAFASGAQELLNMMPVSMGGAARRGAMEYIATIPGGDNARLIPWSVDDERDFLLVLTSSESGAGKLRILDVSYGQVHWFLLDGAGDPYAYPIPYTAAQLASAKYAQNIRQVFVAQADHPMWYIKFNNFVPAEDLIPAYYDFSFGTVRFTSNVAVSTEVVSEELLATDPILADYFYAVMTVLEAGVTHVGPPNISWTPSALFSTGARIGVSGVIFEATTGGTTASTPPVWPTTVGGTVSDGGVTWTYIAGNGVNGIVNGLHVKSILRTETIEPRKAVFIYKDYNDTNFTTTVILASSPTSGLKDAPKWYVGSGPKDHIAAFNQSDSGISILNVLKSRLVAGQSYNVFGDDSGFNFNEYGSVVYTEEDRKSTFTLTYDNNTTKVITRSTTGLTGWVEVLNPALKVNRQVTSGFDILDKVGTWMTPNVRYNCDPSFLLNGSTPIDAIKNIGDDGFATLTVTVSGPLAPDNNLMVINKYAQGYTGRLGVVLTPFSRTDDHPGFVAFHQGRMVAGGSKIEPNVLYMSKVNDYENFTFFEDIQYEKTTINPDSNPDNITYISRQDTVQQVTANSAMKFQLATEENESVRWGAAVEDLIVGTDTSEWVVPADITALNPRIILTTRNGSADMQGRFVNGMVVYVPRSRRGARVFEPKLGQMSADILQHANHLVRGKNPLNQVDKDIIAFDYRADPRQELLMLRRDGTLLVGVMGAESIGWYQVQTRPGDVIESVAGIAAYGEDAVYIVVKRAVHTSVAASGFIRTIERMRTMDDDVFADRVYLDSYEYLATAGIGVTIPRLYTGTSADTWPMISYEDGTYGRLVMNAGGIANSFVDSVTGLGVSMNTAGLTTQKAVIGYPYTSRIKTMRIDGPDTEGLPKSGGAMHLRLLRSGDLALRREYEAESNIHITTPVDANGNRLYPYTGSIRLENMAPAAIDQCIILENDNVIFTADDTVESGVTIHHPVPKAEPMTIQLISAMYSIGDAI